MLDDLSGLRTFQGFVTRAIEKYVVYTGTSRQQFSKDEMAIPYEDFFKNIVPHLT